MNEKIMISSDDFQKALELINKSGRVLLTSHVRVDGDACGCMVALSEPLGALGKQVKMLLLSELPGWYEFLFSDKPAVLGDDVTEEQLKTGEFFDPDLIIIVDTNSNSQLPAFAEYLKANDKQVLVIDHHVTSDGLGDIELVDTEVAAAGVIVLDLFKQAGWRISKHVAQALFVAVATDTGWFRFGNTDGKTLSVVAELAEAGADTAKLYRRIYQDFSEPRFRLMTTMLETLELHFDGRYAAGHIKRDDFKRTGSAHKDTENLIDECQRIGTVEVAALFVELADGRVKCSLRSRGDVDVRKIARHFGGGGHRQAAGTYLPGPLESAKSVIYNEIEKQLS